MLSPDSAPASASPTHSPIAVNERAQASTAVNATAKITANWWRTPRRARGSPTCSRSSSRPGRASPPGSTHDTATGEDDLAGVALRCRCWRENFHPHRQHRARASPRPACHTTDPKFTALPPRLCRGPAMGVRTQPRLDRRTGGLQPRASREPNGWPDAVHTAKSLRVIAAMNPPTNESPRPTTAVGAVGSSARAGTQHTDPFPRRSWTP